MTEKEAQALVDAIVASVLSQQDSKQDAKLSAGEKLAARTWGQKEHSFLLRKLAIGAIGKDSKYPTDQQPGLLKQLFDTAMAGNASAYRQYLVKQKQLPATTKTTSEDYA